jgi:hypothetical protein
MFALIAATLIVVEAITARQTATASLVGAGINVLLVLAVSRLRSRLARGIWTALLIIVLVLGLIAIPLVAVWPGLMPPFSITDVFWSVASLGSDLIAAWFVWRPSASEWIRGTEAKLRSV